MSVFTCGTLTSLKRGLNQRREEEESAEEQEKVSVSHLAPECTTPLPISWFYARLANYHFPRGLKERWSKWERKKKATELSVITRGQQLLFNESLYFFSLCVWCFYSGYSCQHVDAAASRKREGDSHTHTNSDDPPFSFPPYPEGIELSAKHLCGCVATYLRLGRKKERKSKSHTKRITCYLWLRSVACCQYKL